MLSSEGNFNGDLHSPPPAIYEELVAEWTRPDGSFGPPTPLDYDFVRSDFDPQNVSPPPKSDLSGSELFEAGAFDSSADNYYAQPTDPLYVKDGVANPLADLVWGSGYPVDSWGIGIHIR